ncbi:hypothetical protein ACFL1Z_03535, partial [Thermodesulfobacteriota bacterium]
ARDNRITAESMLTVLEHFYPYRHLMRHKGRQYYKTGNLRGVSTRAGYLSSSLGGDYRFVVILNSKGSSSDIVKIIERYLP